MSEPIVSIRNLSKQFGSVTALDDVSIDINAGEIFALLGPSGCGKSTLLRLISGFEYPTEGELLLDGQDMTPLPPNKRPINMVFQSYAVFPHMSVQDNVAYGLKMEKVSKEDIRTRVAEALEQVHLEEFASRMPDQLSGGQRQRVALARALVKKPRVLLLDEPLSALDAKLRDAMRLELVKLQESVGITFIIVTHDQTEAMAMADRIAVLESGRLRQIASPEELYTKPVDGFVADFIGNVNAFSVEEWRFEDEQLIVDTGLLKSVMLNVGEVSSFLGDSHSNSDKSNVKDSASVLTVRPEHVKLDLTEPTSAPVALKGILGDIAFQGQHCVAEVILPDNTSMTAVIDNELAQSLPSALDKASIWAYWDTKDMLILPNNASLS